MVFKHEWNTVQQEIISALSKDLKNYIYQKYDEFFIESALRFFMKPDKKSSFGSLWKQVLEKREIISQVSAASRGGYELWRIQFAHALTALQSFSAGIFGKHLELVLRFLVSGNCCWTLPERLKDPVLKNCVEKGDVAKIIFYLDSLKDRGKKLENIFNMLLNRGKFAEFVELYKYFGKGLEHLSASDLVGRLSRIEDAHLRKEYLKCCDTGLYLFWNELYRTGYLSDYLILCLENGASPDAPLFDFGLLNGVGMHMISLRQYLYLLDELADVLPAVLKKSENDVFFNRLSRLFAVVPQFIEWEKSHHEA